MREEAWQRTCKCRGMGRTYCAYESSGTPHNRLTMVSASVALPARRRLRTENLTLRVTCWKVTPISPCACVLRALRAVESRVRARAVARRVASCHGCCPRRRRRPGAAGALGGARQDQAQAGFGSGVRYAAYSHPGEGRYRAAGEMEALGQGRAARPAARQWGPSASPPLRPSLSSLLSPGPAPTLPARSPGPADSACPTSFLP